MKIVKTANGNIKIIDNNGNHTNTLQPTAVLKVENDDAVLIQSGMNQWLTVHASQVTHTQLEPAAQVAFSGDAYDLIELLTASFFFEVSITTAADVSYDNTDSELAATDVQDAIDELAENRRFTLRGGGQHNFTLNSASSGIVQVNDGTFVAWGFELFGKQNINKLLIEVTNAAGAGTKFVVGIYKNNGNGLPGTKVAQTTEIAGDAVAVTTYNFPTPFDLQPGLYFYCIMSKAAGMFCRALPASGCLPVFGFSALSGSALTRGLVGAGYAYNATMPATAPSIDTFANAPAPFILLSTATL
jgi:hypothetical protein